MSNSIPGRPEVPLAPAVMRISTKRPDAGWWNWLVHFEPAQEIDGNIVAMAAEKSPAKAITLDIRCSHVFDPVPDLHVFIERIKATVDAEWQVDEEGVSVTIQVLYINARLVHLRMFSSCYSQDYCHDFLLNRDNCISTLQAAYHSFGKQDGWGDYGDYAAEDD